MGIATTAISAIADGDLESATLLIPKSSTMNLQKIPKDSFQMAYIVYFTLDVGYLILWNTFITTVDYFSYLYPDVSVTVSQRELSPFIWAACVDMELVIGFVIMTFDPPELFLPSNCARLN
ncbi:equilibrative nucleotide transporter 1 [Forsythia ovata]|uniref:Equilibrative nucleotide transporter 1 n=1 Tax=Forsythia ovata TaxID=205694 RepID=A0ABD1UUN2_9LAMI